MAKFKYFEPADLAAALSLLRNYGDEARIIAGGQSLLILIRQGLIQPQVLISLHRIAQLREIKFEGRQVVLGAMATQRQISTDDGIRARLAALAEAASRVGSIHVQNLGTVGGNLSHAEPNGDSAPALISLGASVLATSQSGERRIPLDEFFRGPFENSLEPEEMVTSVHVPLPADGAFSIYLKHVLRAVDRATIGIGVQLRIDAAGVCADARVGVGGGGPVPFRATRAEALLKGEKISDALMDAIAAEVSAMCDPLEDSHGPAEYKRKMAGVFVKRALRELRAQKRTPGR
ncbi:MAG TPA: FAD binding domain-containing protein [Candidatus Binatia bacterium]|nr:FAD binding domain-containing protein [Candidatus Binatia bacterium]